MSLAVPPPEFSPVFTQIPLSENLIPLDDLGASGGYGRELILPDDVPPVLALPWALGPRLPRVNRCQDDGALNVHVENASGGAGSPVNFQSMGLNGITTAGENPLQYLPAGTSTIYAVSLTVYTDPSVAVATAGYSFMTLELWDHAGHTIGVPLLSSGISWQVAGGNYSQAVTSLAMVFPSPLNAVQLVGVVGGQPLLQLEAGKANIRYSYSAICV